MEQLIILYLIVCSTTIMTSQDTYCRQDGDCFLPHCFCSTFKHPMNRSEIPQMVYLAFDDAIQDELSHHYNYMFLANRTNPNGCPIGITLFVTDESTDYSILKEYFKRGFELAVHSVTHAKLNTGSKVRQEAEEQRNNIVGKAGVPRAEVVGWRSPFLVTAGDPQIDALKQLGFTYDTSLVYRRAEMGGDAAWPFTLDHGWPFQCDTNCPKQSHKGFWEIPINEVWDYKHQDSCAFLDECKNQPTDKEEAYTFIMDNFYHHYDGNRSPVGFNIHPDWFNVGYTRDAMEMALRDMLKMDDVYIVNIKQVVEWMKNPTTLSEIKDFEGFGCWTKSKKSEEIVLLVLGIIVAISAVIGLFVFACRKIRKRSNRNYITMHDIERREKLVPGRYDMD